MKNLSKRQIVTIVVTLITIVLNILANALPFNGKGTGEISDRFQILFVPAGYVFAIWFFIYLGLIAFTIFQALPAQRDSKLLDRIAPAYWIANTANVVWLFLWHWEYFPLTLVVMLVILASLIALYRQFGKAGRKFTRAEKSFVEAPFGIYLGWISVATIANATQVLYYSGWNGAGISPVIWTVIMLTTATILGILMLAREKAFDYAAVLVWAFIGIANKQAGIPTVVYAAWAASGVIILAGLITFIQQRRAKVS
jgi:hypothetical protein